MADNDNPERISRQIEQTADHYDPGVYHERLRTSDSFERTSEIGDNFIPFSTASASPDAKLKLFVVGLIPPSARVTGRVIDRSASITSHLSDQGIPNEGADAAIKEAVATAVEKATIEPPNGPKKSDSSDFWEQYVCMCNRMGVQAEQLARVLQSESGFNASAQNPKQKIQDETGRKVVAKGLNQLTRDTALGLGMTAAEYDDYHNRPVIEHLKYVEKYYGNRARGKDAGELYAINFGAGYYDPETGSLYRKDVPRQNQGYVLNAQLDRDKKGYITKDDLASSMRPLETYFQANINKAKKSLGMDILPPPSASLVGDPPTKDFGPGRSAKAVNSAQKQISANAKTDLNGTALGRSFAEAQRRMATEVQSAIEDMENTPPLRLLVNPQSFKVNNEKLISDGGWTRSGPISEHWGDNQDKIEGSGKLGAFYALDVSGLGGAVGRVTDSGGPGLTRTARQFSASYQNFLSLYQLYRNNAGIYCTDGTGGGDRTSLVYSGSIYIYFDHTLYLGSFDSFSVTEADSSPFTLEYNFSFTVRATFLLDQAPDPRFTYGVSSMNVNGQSPALPVLPTSEPESTIPYRSQADIAAESKDPVVDKKIAELLAEQSKKPAPKGPPARQTPPLPGSLGVDVFDADHNKIGEI